MRHQSPFAGRQHLKKQQRLSTHTTTTPTYDKWSLRLSQFATVVGVAVAVFGYFYSVRPIYQKVLLDEAIAKKEVELKTVTASLEVNYRLLRGHILRSFVFDAGVECGGITMARQPKVVEGQPLKDIPAEELLSADDISKCLDRQLHAMENLLQPLRIHDLEKLKSTVAVIARNLSAKRNEYSSRIRELPVAARKNRALLEPTGLFVQRSLDFLSDASRRTGVNYYPSDEKLFAEGVQRTQLSMLSRYYEEVREELTTIYSAFK